MKKSVKTFFGSLLAITMCINSPGIAMAVPISNGKGYVQEQKAAEEKLVKEQPTEEYEQEYATASEVKRKSAQVASADEQSDWVINEDGILLRYKGSATEIQIPDTVVSIDEKVFDGNRNISKVIIPEGVKEIGYGAFANCEKLEEVILPKSLTKLGTGSFYQCTSLKKIHITGNLEPIYTGTVDGTTYASQGPFSGCSQLKKVTFDKGVTEVPVSLFQGCDGIEEIDLTGIKKLGNSAFRECSNLKKVKLDPELKATFDRTFRDCKELTSINIPKGISSVLDGGKGPFYGCPKLSDVTLEKDTTRIPQFLFFGCTSLKTMDLSGVELIEQGAFNGCENFVGQIDSDGKEELNLKNIKFIDKNAFAGCTALKRIVLGKNFRSVERDALSCPNLTEVYFYDNYYSEEMITSSQIFDKSAPLTAYVYWGSSIYQYIKWWNEKYEEDKINYKLLEPEGFSFQIRKDNWSIPNNWSIARDEMAEFEGKEGKESHPYIPKKTFENVLESKEIAKSLFKTNKKFNGYCVGFTETAKIFYEHPGLFKEKFGQDASINNVFDVKDKMVSYTFEKEEISYEPTAMELMEYFSVSQYRSDAPLKTVTKKFNENKENIDQYCEKEIESIINDLDDDTLVNISIRKHTIEDGEDKYSGHTVLGYDIEDLDIDELKKYFSTDELSKNNITGKQVFIYDCIHPKQPGYILLFKIGENWKWKYSVKVGEDNFEAGNYNKNSSKDYISNVESKFTMDDFETWFSKSPQIMKKMENVLLDIKGGICKLKNQDKDDKFVFVDNYVEAISIIGNVGIENPYPYLYYIPDGIYSFKPADGSNSLSLKLSADNFSADIQEAEAESATISLNDEIVEENWIILEAANGKNADIAFHSSHDNNNFDEISIKGKGNKDQVTYTLKSDGNEVHVDGVTLEQIQITVNEDTEEEKVINLPIENGSGNTHTVKVSSAEGKTNIQVLNEKNQVIASTDENGSSGNGNTGDNQGGNTGDNQGGNSGDNQGGNTGDNQGGNSGNNQGGNTGGSSGSSSGGSSGGGSGSRRSSGGGSSSSARNGLFITKPSYYGTGTWEGNEASTAWKLKTADGTTLALQWGLIDGIWYLFGMDGYTCTGWQLVNNQWYYFHPNAMMHTGWILLDNHWYYLDSTGAMKTGWVLLDNRWYYLDSTGAMQTGWVFYNKQWYYLNADGSMLVNDSTPDGYAVGADGVWMP